MWNTHSSFKIAIHVCAILGAGIWVICEYVCISLYWGVLKFFKWNSVSLSMLTYLCVYYMCVCAFLFECLLIYSAFYLFQQNSFCERMISSIPPNSLPPQFTQRAMCRELKWWWKRELQPTLNLNAPVPLVYTYLLRNIKIY